MSVMGSPSDIPEIHALSDEVRRLKAALTKYGRHSAGCNATSVATFDAACSCGFRAALAGTEQPEAAEQAAEQAHAALQEAVRILNGIDYEEGSRIDRAVLIIDAAIARAALGNNT